MQCVNQHAIFDMQSGSLKYGYQFVQPIYRLTSLIITNSQG